jgi:hypothetical protein
MLDLATGGRSKYDRYARQGRKRIVLVCIKDGAEMEFWDEGPFPVNARGQAVPNWQTLQPTPGRQKLIAAVLKRDEDGLPIFFAKEKGLTVWDMRISRPLEIPHINDDIKAAQERYLAVRADIVARGRAEYEAKQKQMEESAAKAASSSVAALVDALALKIGGAAKADEPKPAKAAAPKGAA